MSVSPKSIEDEIRRLARKLETKTDDLAVLFETAAKAEVTYKVEFAKAVLSSTAKTVGEREAEATEVCAGLYFERKVAEAVADAARESVRSMRDQLSAVQSVGALLRSQMELAR